MRKRPAYHPEKPLWKAWKTYPLKTENVQGLWALTISQSELLGARLTIGRTTLVDQSAAMPARRGKILKIIEFTLLRVGDILLTTSLSPTSWSVRQGTKSDISHAMLYVAASSVIDSTTEGVHARNLQKLFYEDDCAVHALRLVTAPSDGVMSKVVEYARSQTGNKYSLREAAQAVTNPAAKTSERQFCSRFVARAFASAGIYLVEQPDSCTPQQLLDSPLLHELPNPTVPISTEEIESIKEAPNHVSGMIDVTNKFLVAARKLGPNILTFNDALKLLVANPHLDSKFHDALVSSGYLEFWREERREFHWRYDFDAMQRLAMAEQLDIEITDYCKKTVDDFASGVFSHWERNLESFQRLAQERPLASVRALATLYDNLVASSRLRLDVAERWLAK